MKSEPKTRLLIRAEQEYRIVIEDPRSGRPTAEAVAREAREAGDAEALAVALRAAGWASREVYQHEDAARYLDEAVAVAVAHRLADRLSEALVTRSAMHLEFGRPGRARQDIAQAREHGGIRVQAEVAFAEGLLEDKIGDLDAAESAYRRVLRTASEDRPDLRFKALNNLGLTKLRAGRHDEADRLLRQAVEHADTFSPAYAALATESHAIVSMESGRPQEALRRYERAERMLRALDMPLVDLYHDKASLLLSLRLLDEAADAAAHAVEEVDALAGGSLMLAEVLLPKARIALARHRIEDALEASGRAERLFRRQRRPGWRAMAALVRLQAEIEGGNVSLATADRLARVGRRMAELGNVPRQVDAALLEGRVAVSLGRRRRAYRAFERAASASSGGPVLQRLQGRLAAAMQAELVGDGRRLGQHCRRGLDELSEYRASFASTELRARASEHGLALAALGLRSAVRSRRAERVWNWLERSRMALLLAEDGQTADPDARSMLAELRALERELDNVDPEDAATRSTLLRDIRHAEQRIRRARWEQERDASSRLSPSWSFMRSLRAQLGDRLLLQYGVLDDQLLGVAVSRTRMQFAPLGPASHASLSGRRLAFALRRLSQPRSASSVEAAMASAQYELAVLFDMLVAPFVTVEHDDEIVVCPPAALIGIPWGRLADAADLPVRVAPSASMWASSRGRQPRSDRVLLVAGPDVPAATEEVRSIGRRYDHPRHLVGHEASSDQIQRLAAGAALVHLACHGRLRSDSPSFSSLWLADGPLTVHDLERLAEPAHHWVLAACDLGSPGRLAGPDLEGVVAALLHRGAGGVVAAGVSVPDLDTRDLMVELHECLAAGASLPEALRRARRAVDFTDPAGFVAGTAFSCYGGA